MNAIKTDIQDISLLELDHPGANDPAYRLRRAEIAALAARFRGTGEIGDVDYTPEERQTWREAVSRLQVLHRRNASRRYLRAAANLEIGPDRIPQLSELNLKLAASGGFRLAPVAGLIDGKLFLSELAGRTMLCTQYIRHASRPEYTPEPDVVHELVGHAPTFTDPDFAAMTREIGRAAAAADGDALEAIKRLYWFTVEFGLIREGADVRAFGAGLLSSFGELEHCFGPDVDRRTFSSERVVAASYDFSAMQPVLFVAPPFPALRREVSSFLARLGVTGNKAE
ncbi:MAG TPA: phenylalanine 4-monooxygenase [Candidatus Eisenbacteria bacterium]|jgi:phenylalanine-4-hydroxylase|nr:phenylalanine 4-monooxygenase [Candidatus Eisenbacteria bacterium]